MVFILRARVERIRLDAIASMAEERRSFLNRLDHELKNPLTANPAGLANLGESPSSPVHQETLASLETQALRMSHLSSDLRKLAEIEVRQLEDCRLIFLPCWKEAFHVAHEQPGAMAAYLNLSLPQVPWPLPTIKGDSDLLLLAVHNLLGNALKFSSPGDTVELRAFEDGQELVIEVADTVRVFRMTNSCMFGRNCIAVMQGGESLAVVWAWHLFVP